MTHSDVATGSVGYQFTDIPLVIALTYLPNVSSTANTSIYYLGAGKVFGDKAHPDAAVEAVLTFDNTNSSQNQTLSLLACFEA
jgi:hypothetical protein